MFVPKGMQPVYEAIVGFTELFCQAHLNQEYASLSRKMAVTLCRDYPELFLADGPKVWAGGIVYTLAKTNYLSDKSQTPHMTLSQLAKRLGINQTKAAAYARRIYTLLDITLLDNRWLLPSLLEKKPSAWFIMVNGFIVDARQMPREVQEEAFRKGLIPYMPADK